MQGIGGRTALALGLAALALASCDDGGTSGPPTCDDGRRNGGESDVDCGGSCEPCPAASRCVAGGDCASRVCADGLCATSSCDDGVWNGGETDVDCGGLCPARCPGGSRCGEGRDCTSGFCTSGRCDEPACDDGVRNGDESDLDCGGSCDGCDVGGRCEAADDCASRLCSSGRCEPSACDDGLLDGDESDVDCGGSCERCEAGRACDDDEDCASLRCPAGFCDAPACDDEIQNGDESDVDCGGSCERCELGWGCGHGSDCATSFCDAGSCGYPPSCLEVAADDPLAGNGVFLIAPGGGAPVQAYCDLTTDEGGWTLVASSLDQTLNDEAAPWYEDLVTLFPAAGHDGIWDGLRAVIAGASDIRFSCKGDPTAEAMRVDLSFYATSWYRETTTGTDAESCFSEADGEGFERPPPARRDNVAGLLLRRGDEWRAGYLEGEDGCDDEDDFTVDLDDRGMGSDRNDGTDWGEDDGSQKCGLARLTIGSWFVWVREAAPHCRDGELSGEETGRDCGGVCPPCADGGGCVVDWECTSGVCIGGVCQRPSCDDGVQNGGESGVDCGGPCPPCG